MILQARVDQVSMLVTCPNCKFSSRYAVSFIEDAIHDKFNITCVACGEKFIIVTISQTRAAEQQDEASGEGAGETPNSLRTED